MIRLGLIFTLILLCAVISQPQSRLNSPSSKSAIVIFQGSDPTLSGNHSGVCYLKLNGAAKRFSWGDAQTHFYNFRADQAWNRGAEWRIVYNSEHSPDYDFTLLSVTFTGRVISENNRTAVRPVSPRGASSSSNANLVGVLRNINADGPGCYFSFADSRLMFFDSWSGDTLMNIDGGNVRLHLVKETSPKGRVRVGSQITKLYSTGDITVNIVEVKTKSGWSAIFNVRKGNRTQTVRATGVCGD